jgi:hypothetical protein
MSQNFLSPGHQKKMHRATRFSYIFFLIVVALLSGD